MSYREYPCDLCGGHDAVEVPHAREYTGGHPIHICTGCGLVHVKRRRSPEEVARTWTDEVFGGQPGLTLARNYTARIPAVKARQVFVAEFIDTSLGLRGKRVCDIGTGEGQFLEIIRADAYGAAVFGTEATTAYCLDLRKRDIPCFPGTVEEFVQSVEGRSYRADIATLMWTLECSASCRSVLEAAARLVPEGGHVVVATGSRLLVPFKKPLHLYLDEGPPDTHPVRFSVNTLRGVLAVASFRTVHVNRYLDSDVLCVIAEKQPPGTAVPWRGDDYRAVLDFFERWHRESRFYREAEREG